MECAIRTANKNNADFILATDPDADRFALAERDTQGISQTGWRILSGNHLGALLGKLVFCLKRELIQDKQESDHE